MELVNSMFNLVINVVVKFTDILLSPIYLLITTFIPPSYVSTISDRLTLLFDGLADAANYFLSFTGIDNNTLVLLKMIWIFIFSAPIAVKGVKIALDWYNHLKF